MILRVVQGLAVTLVAGLLGLLVWRVVHQDGGGKLVREIAVGHKPSAPAFRLRPIWREAGGATPLLRDAVSRGQVAVSDLRGRPTIVNVFASWCIPCRDEAPLFSAAEQRYSGRVQFVGLDFQDFDSDGRSFLQRYGSSFAALRDQGGDVSHRWGATGVPETYVLDRTGRIVAHAPGAVGAGDLQSLIATALRSG